MLALEEAYQRLFATCSTAHIDNAFAYLVANAKVRRKADQWRLYAAFQDNEMLGCYFGYRSVKRKLGIKVPAFILGCEFVSEPLLSTTTSEAVLSSLIKTIMADQSDCVLFEFQYLTPACFDQLSARLLENKLSFLWEWAGYGYSVNLPDSTEQFLSGMGTKTRAEINRKYRRLQEKYSVRFEFSRPRDSASNIEKFDTFLRLENKGWKGRQGTAILKRTGNRDYFLELIASAAKADQLAWCELHLDDSPVAMYLCLISHDRLWLPKVAYDEEFASYGPGIIATHLLLLRCIQDASIKTVHCISGPAWMNIWRPAKVEYRSLLLFNQNLKAEGLFNASRVAESLRSFRRSEGSDSGKRNNPYA